MPCATKQLFNLSLEFSDGYDEISGESSPVRPSSPDGPDLSPPTREELLAVIGQSGEHANCEEIEDDYGSDYTIPVNRKSPQTLDQKIAVILDYMHTVDNHLSLYKFISGVFNSGHASFYSENSHIKLMDLWWMQCGEMQDINMKEWIMNQAAEICAREASFLTNRASEGPYFDVAKSLCLPSSKVKVNTINSFQLQQLEKTYNEVTPNFQKLLQAFTTSSQSQELTKNHSFGQVMITSMALNMRSIKTNYHQAINSLIFWDNCVPKRLTQMLNQLSICSSYPFQIKAVASLSKSASQLAKKAANDPLKIKMLPYDNFNWMSHVWESSTLHKSKTHDEVSALLVILPTPLGGHASKVTSVKSFKKDSRHTIDVDDLVVFRKHAVIHIQNILAELIAGLDGQKNLIPKFKDNNAINHIKTEEYYLPTFDQEQGSTRGNMVVLEHYFGKTFEETMFTVLGDCLTVAWDRAAQDQRALYLSPDVFDHLSSIRTVGGLMHYEMNFISAIAGNYWGSSGNTDAISLSTLHKLFPNQTEINPRKINYYACYIQLDTNHLSKIATVIVEDFCNSPDCLEGMEVKTLLGGTVNGHTVLLFHDILTLQEMHDTVKQGHPTWVLHMIKFWMPMFYAAGCYNYSNECMEMLHNIIHDWPTPYADIAFKGMFFNPQGRVEDFKPTDIHVEHLNDCIKEHAHVLEKIVPAMGYVQDLTDHIFDEMGVEDLNQIHRHVSQSKDILIILQHLVVHHIFNFSLDTPSSHAVTDLLTHDLNRMAGANGEH
ncbi:hypothetical protein BDQ17DRAFT_1393664 [Cyathus striatus]|nr:hypothetical protein BDQ17DRAFT_1393664 [Cyathus striatus]